MRKIFKTKKNIIKNTVIKCIFIILLFILIIKFCFKIMFKINILDNLFYNDLNSITDNLIKLNTPNELLSYYDLKAVNKNYLKKANYIKNNEMKNIYIYNTHQKESYKDNVTVYEASKYLQKKIKSKNINVVLENGNISEFMQTNNMSYDYSYVASKYFILEELKKKNYNLIIDLHRDSASKSSTTISINNKKYAKVLFVVGKDHKNYKYNYTVAEKINKLITAKYSGLSKGIILKSGKNVNGIYNQNINKNMVLIEVGGNFNTFDEVKNTLDILSDIIGVYMYEN